jgi:hypothetical protein
MWKLVYQNYLNAYLKTPSTKETLKDHSLQEFLKELKMGNSNEKHFKKGDIVM